MRPLWPTIGIVAVAIVVTLFIVIGHFVDKLIEQFETELGNPSTFTEFMCKSETAVHQTHACGLEPQLRKSLIVKYCALEQIINDTNYGMWVSSKVVAQTTS